MQEIIKIQEIDYAIEKLIFKVIPNIEYDSKKYLLLCDKLTDIICEVIGRDNITYC